MPEEKEKKEKEPVLSEEETDRLIAELCADDFRKRTATREDGMPEVRLPESGLWARVTDRGHGWEVRWRK